MIKIYLEGKVQNYTVVCFPIDYNKTAIKNLDIKMLLRIERIKMIWSFSSNGSKQHNTIKHLKNSVDVKY